MDFCLAFRKRKEDICTQSQFLFIHSTIHQQIKINKNYTYQFIIFIFSTIIHHPNVITFAKKKKNKNFIINSLYPAIGETIHPASKFTRNFYSLIIEYPPRTFSLNGAAALLPLLLPLI